MTPRAPTRLLAFVLVLTALAAFWWWRSGQGGLEPGAIDLIELFADAEKRTTMGSLEDAFAIETVVINGDRRRSLFAHPFSRVTWTVSVPEGAVLRTAVALRPDTWTSPSDGAIFRIGVSDGPTYTNLVRHVVRPQDEPEDRRWFPIEVDLSAYAGREVKVIFNTEPGEIGNAVGDACVWGAPRIVPGATVAQR